MLFSKFARLFSVEWFVIEITLPRVVRHSSPLPFWGHELALLFRSYDEALWLYFSRYRLYSACTCEIWNGDVSTISWETCFIFQRFVCLVHGTVPRETVCFERYLGDVSKTAELGHNFTPCAIRRYKEIKKPHNHIWFIPSSSNLFWIVGIFEKYAVSHAGVPIFRLLTHIFGLLW